MNFAFHYLNRFTIFDETKQTIMKKIIKLLSVLVIAFGFCYLMGCFYEASFDITEWEKETRGAAAFWGGFFSMCLAFCVILIVETPDR